MITGFDFNTTLPIARRPRRPTTPAIRSRRCRSRSSRSAAALLYPDTGGPQGRVGADADELHAALWDSPGCRSRKPRFAAVTGLFYDVLGANRINANQVGYSRTTNLVPSREQRADVRRHAGQPLPERAAGAGRQRSRPHVERRVGRELSLCRRRRVTRGAIAFPSAPRGSCRGRILVEGTYVGVPLRASAGLPSN